MLLSLLNSYFVFFINISNYLTFNILVKKFLNDLFLLYF